MDYLTWLHLNTTLDTETKIKLIRSRGYEGFGIYCFLIELLADQPNYRLETNFNQIAGEMHLPDGEIKSVVCDFGIFKFTDDGKFFHSEKLDELMKNSKMDR